MSYMKLIWILLLLHGISNFLFLRIFEKSLSRYDFKIEGFYLKYSKNEAFLKALLILLV